MEEIWEDIVGYEGLYQVSNLGRVKSLDRIDASGHRRKGKILKPKINHGGYVQINLYNNSIRKTVSVHRIVAIAFIPNDDIENKTEVNHLNEVKTDNRVENLQWCSPKENVNHGTCIERRAKTCHQTCEKRKK